MEKSEKRSVAEAQEHRPHGRLMGHRPCWKLPLGGEHQAVCHFGQTWRLVVITNLEEW